MKSETRTGHHRSSGYACMHVSYRLHHLQNICLTFELVHLNAHISLFIDIFVIFVIHRYTRKFVLKFTETEIVKKCIQFAFIILQKHVLLLLWVHTNKCRAFTDFLTKNEGVFEETVSAALLYSVHTLHRHFNSTHFSGLTSDWAAL